MTLSGLTDDGSSMIWINISASLIFEILLSLILVSFHWYNIKKGRVQNITDDNIGVCQIKIVETNLNKSELIYKLKSNPTIGKMKLTDLENGVLFKTGMTMKSWN